MTTAEQNQAWEDLDRIRCTLASSPPTFSSAIYDAFLAPFESPPPNPTYLIRNAKRLLAHLRCARLPS